MQDIDRPADIEALALPARARRARVQGEPLRAVPALERPDGIGGHRRRGRDGRKGSPGRPQEPELPLPSSLHYAIT